MLSVILWAQLAASSPADSTYASTALRDLIAAAAAANHQPPPAFGSYMGHIETESSLLIRDTLGREHTAEVEQLAATAHWVRDGRYELHVIGYRSQSVGVPYSTLSIVRAWTVPSLYGERLSLGAYFNRARGRGRADSLIAVHPFAADRDRYYRFSGGDTVALLRSGARTIPIVRIRVRPAIHDASRLGAFDGEIDLDGERKQIVRMRGQFVVAGGSPTKRERFSSAALGLTAAAYVEFVNAEIDGLYWLPAFQRTEFQASFAIFGQTRPIFRLISTFRDIQVTAGVGATTASDSTISRRVVLTWAPSDTVDAFAAWRAPIGTASASVHSDDFADLAPDEWRSTGPPRLDLFPNTMTRLFRFNRVEGLFLGVAPSLSLRSAMPGVTIGAFGGWAFTEKTARGGAFADYRRGSSTSALHVERALVTTNDFAPPMSDDPGVAALLGSIDNYDYVDRSMAIASFTHVLGSVNAGLITTQIGFGRDRAESTRLTKGLFGSVPFAANRPSADGTYLLGTMGVEAHPNVTGDFVTPGIGGRLFAEAGQGDLTWQRAEISIAMRQYFGAVALALHADGGALFGGTLPPQKLFELGGNAALPGFAYKQFAGDRAALARAFATYRVNVWNRPVRVWRYVLPAPSPGVVASVQGGWAEQSSAAARSAVRRLGVTASGQPLSTPTGGARATGGVGLTLFSDLIHVGVARPLEAGGKWRAVVGFGTIF